MLCDEALELRLRLIGQRIVCGTQIGELRLPTSRGDRPRGQQRIFCRQRLERAVGVPQPIAQTVHTPSILALEYVALRIEIGNVGDVLVEPELVPRPQLS